MESPTFKMCSSPARAGGFSLPFGNRCCASKPGKPVLELCLAHLPHRGDARWKLSDNGAIKNLVQIGVKEVLATSSPIAMLNVGMTARLVRLLFVLTEGHALTHYAPIGTCFEMR